MKLTQSPLSTFSTDIQTYYYKGGGQNRSAKLLSLILLVALFLQQNIWANEDGRNNRSTYKTVSFTDDIRTLQSYLNDNQLDYPVIQKGSSDYVTISFDFMTMDYPHLSYRIKACNADWSLSSIDEMDYMQGINEVVIDDPEPSYNTTFDYSHYTFRIPNDDIKLTLSGNYVVEVFNTDYKDRTLLTACFSIEENKTDLKGNVSGKSVYGVNTQYQHLSFELFPHEYFSPIAEELTVVVRQNGRHDNEVFNPKPTYAKPTSFVYDDERALSFEGGREYYILDFSHRFRYSGKINRISFHNPYYHVEVMEGKHDVGNAYNYDKDVNGHFKVHGQDIWSAAEIDYSIVHFTYPAEEPWLDGAVYVLGGFNDNWLTQKNKMVYNFDRKQYELAIVLKNGGYNFQYVFLPSGWNSASTIQTEGSYWETENSYQIYVYYRPIGSNYDHDQLVGFFEIYSQ